MRYTVLERKELFNDGEFRCLAEVNRDKNGYIHFVCANTLNGHTEINEVDDKLYLGLVEMYGGVRNELKL